MVKAPRTKDEGAIRPTCPNVRIPSGVFSHTLDLGEAGVRSIAYNTCFQTVSLLEDESARVWNLLYEANGVSRNALDYILQNGEFESDPLSEAATTLEEFARELAANGLVELPGISSTSSGRLSVPCEPGRGLADEEAVQTEMAYARLAADHHRFYSLVLELTYRCNETCVHCYCPGDRLTQELTLFQIEKLLDEFQTLGGFALQLTGGEIFVRSDIRQLLRSLERRKLLVSITSNLTLLDDERADLVASLYPKWVGCSIYSADPDLHDSVTRVPGSFRRSIAAIRRLRARGIPVALKTPVLASTAAGWRDVAALAADLGCGSQFDLNITARNDGDISTTSHRLKDEALIADILRNAYPSLFFGDERPADAKESACEPILCGAGATGLLVAPDGWIRPCIALPTKLGRWPSDSLETIWKTSGFFREWSSKSLKSIEKCGTCGFVKHCIRCPGSWIAEKGEPIQPLDYSCRLSEIRSFVQRA